jgi:hypothetical protein
MAMGASKRLGRYKKKKEARKTLTRITSKFSEKLVCSLK